MKTKITAAAEAPHAGESALGNKPTGVDPEMADDRGDRQRAKLIGASDLGADRADDSAEHENAPDSLRDLTTDTLGAEAEVLDEEAALLLADSNMHALSARLARLKARAVALGISEPTLLSNGRAADYQAPVEGARAIAQLSNGELRAEDALLRGFPSPGTLSEMVTKAVRAAIGSGSRDLVNRKRLARILGVEPKTIATFVNRDGLPAHGVGKSQFFFMSEVTEWIRDRVSRPRSHADRHGESLKRLEAVRTGDGS